MPCPRRGLSVPDIGQSSGQGHRMVPLPLLDSPQTFLAPRLRSRGETGHGGSVPASFSLRTLYRPEFIFSKPPRITVRGCDGRGACTPLRKSLSASTGIPRAPDVPVGPLAFRRATGGSRVQRRVWGVKRGKGTIGALSPLVSAARRRQCHAMSWRTSPRPGGPVSPPPAAPLYRRGGKRSAGQRLQ